MIYMTPKPTKPRRPLDIGEVPRAYMDSSYDKTYGYLEAKGIEAVIKPRSRADRESSCWA